MRVFLSVLIIVFLSGNFSPAGAKVSDRPIPAWPLIYYFPKDDGATMGAAAGILHYKREGTLRRYALRPFILSTETDPKRNYLKTSLIWPLNVYERKGEDRSFRSFPFIWYGRSLNARYSVFFPVYWNIKNPSGSHFHVWPLMGVDRSGAGTTYSSVFPFFRYSRDLESKNFNIHFPWPLVNFKRDGVYISHRVLPIYWRERGPDGSGGFLFPYFWRTATDVKSRGIFPLWYSSRGDDLKTDLVFPFYFGRRHSESQIRFITPLYFDSISPDSRLRILLPLFAVKSSPERTFRVITPFYFSSWSEKSRLQVFFPFYLGMKGEKSSLRMVTPLYLTAKNDRSRTDLLFPVFLSVRDFKDKRTFQVGLPSFLRFRSERHLFSAFFPFYFHSRDFSDDTELKYYFPVYGSYRKGADVSRHFIFFPLYSRMRDEQLKSTSLDILWPFFHYSSSPSKSSTRILPVLWKTKSPDRDLTVSFPFYWYLRNGENSYRHLFPLYGVNKKGEGYSRRFFLGPVFISTHDREAGLSQQDILFPLFHRSREGEASRTWLIPLYFSSSRDAENSFTFGSAALLPPYYFHLTRPGRDVKHLWPFFGYGREGSKQVRSVLWPLVRFSHDLQTDSRLSWVVPFYFHKGGPESKLTLGALALLPPYYIHKTGKGGDGLHHLWPFFGRLERGSYREYSTLWPLFRYGKDPEHDERMAQFLLFYQKREARDLKTTFFPLWWHHSDAHSTRDLSLLLHWYDRENDRTRFSFGWVIPHYLALFKYQNGPGLTEHAVFPLYGYKRNTREDSLRVSFLWPLFSYSSEGEFARQTGFLWKVISYERSGPEESDFRFLWRLIRKSKTPTASRFEFNPIFYHESEEGKGSYWAILGGLIGRETTEDGETDMRWLWFF